MQAVIPVALIDMQGHTPLSSLVAAWGTDGHDVHTLVFCVCRFRGHWLKNRVNAQKLRSNSEVYK